MYFYEFYYVLDIILVVGVIVVSKIEFLLFLRSSYVNRRKKCLMCLLFKIFLGVDKCYKEGKRG